MQHHLISPSSVASTVSFSKTTEAKKQVAFEQRACAVQHHLISHLSVASPFPFSITDCCGDTQHVNRVEVKSSLISPPSVASRSPCSMVDWIWDTDGM